MPAAPLHDLPLTELSRRVHAGELSPVELTEHFLARISQLDGSLHAFRLVLPERARAEARAAEAALRAGVDLGDLHGLPYAAKDIYDVQGLPTTAGTHLRADAIAQEDSTVTRRLAQAGMVLLGKTNTVQFAYGSVGINHDHGTPHNPWQRQAHVPGGSSSGSAVAVAAGLAPMGLGSDTGGSIRLPAGLCGTVGLKTTVGRISRAGIYPLSFTLDSAGPLCRSVEDAALVHQALIGEDPRDESTLAVGPQDVLRGLRAGVKGLRLAFAETVFFEDCDAETARAVREAGRALADLGASVDSIAFPEARQALDLNPKGMISAVEGYAQNRHWLEQHFDALDPVVAQRMRNGRGFTAPEYVLGLRRMAQVRAQALEALAQVDALLVPTSPLPALPLAQVDASVDTYMGYATQYARNTFVGNLLNLCGLSVPCGWTGKGLPIGLMIYCKPFQEDLLLRIGHAFEQATPWHERRPDLAWAG